MSSYFITGGNGFIGAALTKKLVLEGQHVRVMVRPGANLHRLERLLTRIEIVPGDFEHLDAVERSLVERKADAFIHAAWAGVTADQRNSLQQITVNIPAALRLCELAAATNCTTFVGIGSQAEYGSVKCVLDEHTPANPTTPYGFAKYTAGEICRKLCIMGCMRFVWLRILSIYGPGDDDAHMLPTVIRCLLRGEKPELTHGSQKWDYLYIDDCATAINSVLHSEAEGVFVLGSGESTTIREAVELVRDKIDRRLALGFGEVNSGQVLNLQADIGHLTRITGWRPEVSLSAGLDLTIASIAGESIYSGLPRP